MINYSMMPERKQGLTTQELEITMDEIIMMVRSECDCGGEVIKTAVSRERIPGWSTRVHICLTCGKEYQPVEMVVRVSPPSSTGTNTHE